MARVVSSIATFCGSMRRKGSDTICVQEMSFFSGVEETKRRYSAKYLSSCCTSATSTTSSSAAKPAALVFPKASKDSKALVSFMPVRSTMVLVALAKAR